MAERFFRIHPAIGVARVGDAEREGDDFFFIGPEIPGVPPNFDPGTKTFRSFKKDGKVKPQAVRFRIFEYAREADGSASLVGEVKLGEAGVSAIGWTVHVANRKASFCNFAGQKGAEDTPYFSSYAPEEMRNGNVKGLQNRKDALDLDPGPASIEGGVGSIVDLAITRPPRNKLTRIKSLGQLRSDAEGRLIFIGGRGIAEAVPKSAKLREYANNPGWFDDVSDGPVTADLVVDGNTIAADAAWVVVGPPDFAPAFRSYRTMYDTLADMMVRYEGADGRFAEMPAELDELRRFWRARDSADPPLPSFTRHIYPILSSIARAFRVFQSRPGGPDFHGSLADFDSLGGSGFNPARAAAIVARTRDPETTASPPNVRLMPRVLGDYYGEANGRGGANDPQFLHSVSILQYALLKAWRAGKVEMDWTGIPAPPASITPDGLDRAGIENCVGGPFFPGIEVGWLIAKPEVFRSAFRLASGAVVGSLAVPRLPGDAGPDRRDLVIEAGSLSQQMAQPWHADFRDCKKEQHFERSVAWWPVQRPDDVLVSGGPAARLEWARDMKEGDDTHYREMVDKWSTRGFVVETGGDFFEVEGPAPLVA